VRAELGLLEYDGGVDVGDGPAQGVDASGGFLEELAAVAGFVARVVVGEELTDIGKAGGGEQSVGDGVEQGVAVAVGDGAAVKVEGDAADDERATRASRRAGLEAVQVVAVADTQAIRE
jgi:hypothetical protein